MYKRVRLTNDERKQLIITTGVKVALDVGLYSVSLSNVADAMENGTKAIIKTHFNQSTLRTAIVEAAIDQGHSEIVAQAITMKHDAVSHFTDDERKAWLANV